VEWAPLITEERLAATEKVTDARSRKHRKARFEIEPALNLRAAVQSEARLFSTDI